MNNKGGEPSWSSLDHAGSCYGSSNLTRYKLSSEWNEGRDLAGSKARVVETMTVNLLVVQRERQGCLAHSTPLLIRHRQGAGFVTTMSRWKDALSVVEARCVKSRRSRTVRWEAGSEWRRRRRQGTSSWWTFRSSEIC